MRPQSQEPRLQRKGVATGSLIPRKRKSGKMKQGEARTQEGLGLSLLLAFERNHKPASSAQQGASRTH